MRAEVNDKGQVVVFVEDSGSGISLAKKPFLFSRYQESLDLLQQGTGIGLDLSKKLMRIMGGDLYLDEHYDSGINGSPGACFVVDLKATAVDLNEQIDDNDVGATSPHDIEAGLVGEETEASTDAADKLTIQTESTGGSSNFNKGVDGTEGEKCEIATGNVLWGQNAVKESKRGPPESAIDDKTEGTAKHLQLTPPVPQSSEPELPENKTVLFVDDDAMLRKLFMRAVKRVAPASWTIQEASSGEMALKLCESATSEGGSYPDIIFMDQYSECWCLRCALFYV